MTIEHRTLTDLQVRPLIAHLVPPETAAKIAVWVKDKDYRVAALESTSLDDLKNMPHAEKDVLAENVHAAYCKARGLPCVYAPENLLRAVDMAAAKFRFADRHALRERSEALYQEISSGLAARPWLDNYITRQAIEEQGRQSLSHFVNTWWKEWQETWTDSKKAFYQQCQDNHAKATSKIYSPDALFEAVQEFLSAHPDDEYTYNQVCDGLQMAKSPRPGALEQRMKVKDVLERISNAKQNIYEDVIKYVTRPGKKGSKSATVYKWAPQRRKLDRNPRLRGVIIKDVILDFVRHNPDCSQKRIVAAVRSALGQIDTCAVLGKKGERGALREMIEGELIDEPLRGAHNTYLYRVSARLATPPEKAPAASRPEHAPNDIFGVGKGSQSTADRKSEPVVSPSPAPKKPWEWDEETILRIASKRREPRSL